MSITKKQKQDSHYGQDASDNNIGFGTIYTPKEDLQEKEKDNNN